MSNHGDATYQLVDQFGATLSNQMTVDGLTLNTFGVSPSQIATNVRNIKHLRIRDDDVLLCSYPKIGTRWTFEIVSLLKNGSSDIGSRQHISFLEMTSPEEIEQIPSPRILNTHIPFERLPVQVKQKKTKKIVLCLRNPKDQIVSYYNYHLGVKQYNYTGTFPGHLRWVMEDKLQFGSWFDHVLGFEKAMKLGEVPIHLVYYEDLKENGLDEIRKLARFLEVSADDNLCAAIHDKVQFGNMKTREYNKYFTDFPFKSGSSFYRKGIIGDWKNYFTVAESEDFDRIFEEKMKMSKLKFRFTPSQLLECHNAVGMS